MAKKYENGLVLSGGGARGFAHLGALQALEENNWDIHVISGVSAGAIMGAFYAAGYRPREIHDILKKLKIFDYSRVSIAKGGLLQLSGMQKLLKGALQVEAFSDLNIPLYVAATNLNKGRIEYIHEGNLVDAVVASSSIPVLFKPHTIGNYKYVDGGVFDNLPAKPIRNSVKRLIGVHVNPINDTDDVDSIKDIATRVFQLTVASTVDTSMAHCDMIVQPLGLHRYHVLDNSKVDDLYDAGYKEMNKVLKHKKVAFKSSLEGLMKIGK